MDNLYFDAAFADAEKRAIQIGERFTEPRKQVFQSLLNSQSPLKAYDILNQVSNSHEKNTKPPTIYRALEFLCRIGVVHKIESDASYYICSHNNHCKSATHSPLFLICKNCGQVEEIHINELENSIQSAALNSGFALSKMMLEVHGICAKCQNN
jgi:Fur family transcriptional regulator, zinc uptake regulator